MVGVMFYTDEIRGEGIFIPEELKTPRDSLGFSFFISLATPPFPCVSVFSQPLVWLYHGKASLVGVSFLLCVFSVDRGSSHRGASPFNRRAPSTRALHAPHLSIVGRHVS